MNSRNCPMVSGAKRLIFSQVHLERHRGGRQPRGEPGAVHRDLREFGDAHVARQQFVRSWRDGDVHIGDFFLYIICIDIDIDMDYIDICETIHVI